MFIFKKRLKITLEFYSKDNVNRENKKNKT